MNYFAIFVGMLSICVFFGLCWAVVVMTIAEQHEFNELEEAEHGE